MLYTRATKLAMRICFDAHRDQVDKSGLPYVFHPFHLAEQMDTEHETCVALLHDVMEDTTLTAEDLVAAGIPTKYVETCKLLTHARDMDYLDYVNALKDDPVARKVKLADLAHNSDTSRLNHEPTAADLRRADKYRTAKAILMEAERMSGAATSRMKIRPTEVNELDDVMRIYDHARAFMAAHGNPLQWGPTNWPPRALIRADISAARSFVCETGDGKLAAVFFYDYGEHVEPCYDRIEDGEWMEDTSYGVVHRIASAGIARGAATACIDWALDHSGHLRIDTHPDNLVMRNLLAKLGFSQRGVIHVAEDDMPRLAFERVMR